MLITAIEPRRKQLSALYIDGEYVMKLDTQTLIENRFDVGREIDDDDLREIISLSNERRAKEKALWLISYRSHSKKELKDKLKRNYDEEAAEKAADRMEELGLINDEEFARQYARKLILTKKMSARAAEYELIRKGIGKALSEEIINEIDCDPQEQILAVINKKYKNISDEKVKRRAVAALQRLGYGWEDIKSALDAHDLSE